MTAPQGHTVFSGDSDSRPACFPPRLRGFCVCSAAPSGHGASRVAFRGYCRCPSISCQPRQGPARGMEAPGPISGFAGTRAFP